MFAPEEVKFAGASPAVVAPKREHAWMGWLEDALRVSRHRDSAEVAIILMGPSLIPEPGVLLHAADFLCDGKADEVVQ